MWPPALTWPRCRPQTCAILAYAVLALAFAWPLPLHLATCLTGSPEGDTGVYVWNLWVFQHEILVHRASPYFSDTIFALTDRANLSLHNYTTLANLLALPLIGVLDSRCRRHLQHDLSLHDGAVRVRHVPARAGDQGWGRRRGVACGCGVRLVANAGDPRRRSLQPRRRRTASFVRASADTCSSPSSAARRCLAGIDGRLSFLGRRLLCRLLRNAGDRVHYLARRAGGAPARSRLRSTGTMVGGRRHDSVGGWLDLGAPDHRRMADHSYSGGRSAFVGSTHRYWSSRP